MGGCEGFYRSAAQTDREVESAVYGPGVHLLSLDHTKLTFKFQGRDFRLTDVHGNVMTKLLA
jgi:hypothetical protein